MVVGIFRLLAAQADLKDVGGVGGLGVALGEFQDNSTLLGEIANDCASTRIPAQIYLPKVTMTGR